MSNIEKLGLMTEDEISAYADSVTEEAFDLTGSPTWSIVLKALLSAAPAGMVFI